MSTVPANPTRITFRTSNNHEFEVDEAVVMELGTVKTFFDENPNASDGPIPLPNVSSKCLSTIIEYRKFHLALRARGDSLAVEDEAKAYDDELVKGHDNESLIELVLAVNFLNIKDMLDMLKQGIADRIENKRVEYVRKFFGIENDYTAEEEAEVRAQPHNTNGRLKGLIQTKVD